MVVLFPEIAISNAWSLQGYKGQFLLFPLILAPGWDDCNPRAPYQNGQGCCWTCTATQLSLPTLLCFFSLPQVLVLRALLNSWSAHWFLSQSLQSATHMAYSVVCSHVNFSDRPSLNTLSKISISLPLYFSLNHVSIPEKCVCTCADIYISLTIL